MIYEREAGPCSVIMHRGLRKAVLQPAKSVQTHNEKQGRGEDEHPLKAPGPDSRLDVTGRTCATAFIFRETARPYVVLDELVLLRPSLSEPDVERFSVIHWDALRSKASPVHID